MPRLFDTGELEILEAAERSEKLAVSAAKQSLSGRSRDFVADHPLAAVGTAAAVATTVALVARSPLGGRAVSIPARLALTSVFGAFFGEG
ncbi:hypothetical protein Poly30_46490 [Planctomycetes bacterium Poly30]|uniref:Uncharacterized protein n=1 Tax=Saltatorellus ferox TaxID=2528018 RepID=A0A518EYE3_9BACT|nr:hypothetical protein Poly30_46490 [Planctomycetes bacterium Poly30]